MKHIIALFALLASSSVSQAGTSQTYTSGNASVTFSLVGEGLLQVTLSNQSLATITSPQDVLTGVSFTLPQNVNLTAVSATIGSGSQILNCLLCPSGATDISANWGYAGNVSVTGSLIAASDFGILTAMNSFKAGNTLGLGGADFGLVGSASFGQSAMSGSPLVTNQAIFLFSSNRTLDTSLIGSIGFFYGNGLLGGDGFAVNLDTPEPSAYLLMGAGLTLMGLWRRKSARRQA